MSRASVRCYWRRPLGHPWEIKERGGKTWLRCTSCGKVRRYWGSMGRLDPDPEAMAIKGRFDVERERPQSSI